MGTRLPCQILPKAEVRRDLRHILQNCRALDNEHAALPVRRYLAGEIYLSAFLPTQWCFHLFWEQVMSEFALANHNQILNWIRGCLLASSNGLWKAPWQAGLSTNCLPGYTPVDGNQPLERLNSTMKNTLPDKFHLMALSDVAHRCEASMRTIFCPELRKQDCILRMPSMPPPRQ